MLIFFKMIKIMKRGVTTNSNATVSLSQAAVEIQRHFRGFSVRYDVLKCPLCGRAVDPDLKHPQIQIHNKPNTCSSHDIIKFKI